MHIPEKFKPNNDRQLIELMHAYPFATVLMHSENGLEAHHIPFITQQSGDQLKLLGHIGIANALWKHDISQSEVLVVFSGPQCYVSPNHYPTKVATGKAVPTWNYTVVHAKGTIKFIHDDAWKLDLVTQLTDEHEAKQAKPWSVSDAPQVYIEKMLSAIVGLEVDVLSLQGQFKLSQNQPEQNILGVVKGLARSKDANDQTVSNWVHNANSIEPKQ